MTPYGPVSLALLYDPRVRRLTWAERGVLHHLSLVAGVSPDGRTVPIERRPGEADVAAWEQTFGVDGARIIGDLVTRGLLALCPEGLRVTLAARDGSAPAGARVNATSGAIDAGKPSDSPSAVRARHDRSAFRARAKGWARVPAGLTWEAWLATPEGVSFVASREADFPGYADRVTPRVTPSPSPGDAPRVTPGDAPPSPPRTPPLSPREKHSEGARGDAPGDAPGVTPGDAARVTPLTGAAALDALRDAARDVADLVGPAYERSVVAVLAGAKLSSADVQAMASALAAPAAWWPKSYREPAPERVTLASLAGFRAANGDGSYTCEPLLALLAHARATSRRGASQRAARSRAGAPPPPPPPAACVGEAAVRAVARSISASRDTSPDRPQMKESVDADA